MFFGGVRVTHLISFLCCVFCWCPCYSSYKFSVLCFWWGCVAHLFSFLCCVFGGAVLLIFLVFCVVFLVGLCCSSF